MKVIDLDPPQPALRLVSTSSSATETQPGPLRDHRYRTSAPLYGPARELYRQVLQAALQQGTPIDADALRVILATKQASSAAPIDAFSAAEIWQLMFVDIVAWCRNRKLEVPVRCAQALTATIIYLDTTNSLAPESDHVEELHDAIDECTGGWVEPVAPDTHSVPASPRRALRSGRGPKRS